MTVVHAEPTKDFFVNMITRDISLEDSILDLVDNSIDAAIRSVGPKKRKGKSISLKGFSANLNLSRDQFSIEDNCGGISIENAENKAFHFGRIPGSDLDVDFGIGIYGIGMKRAVFKLGRKIQISSSAGNDSFVVLIDVDKWMQKPNDWDFELSRGKKRAKSGTKIVVDALNTGVGRKFAGDEFVNDLKRIMARDYSFILESGFEIKVNGKKIRPHEYKLLTGGGFKPVKYEYIDKGVSVEIVAGMASRPANDLTASEKQGKGVSYDGWFVACNERIVLAADKSAKTVWGDAGFSGWHNQYSGFMGIVKFRSTSASDLPWTTTKRDIDQSSPVYRRAIAKMKAVTRAFTRYTNSRRKDLESASKLEGEAVAKPLGALSKQQVLKVPIIQKPPSEVFTSVQYKVNKEELGEVKRALGKSYLSNSHVGRITFDYFYENEVEE